MRPMQAMGFIRYMQDTFGATPTTLPTADQWKNVMAYLQIDQIKEGLQTAIREAVAAATAQAQAKADSDVVAVVAALPDAPPDLVAVAAEAAPDDPIADSPDNKPVPKTPRKSAKP